VILFALGACVDAAPATGVEEQAIGDGTEVDASACNQDGDSYDAVSCGGCDLDDHDPEVTGPRCGTGCTSNICGDPNDRQDP
jgi:hypothetical protein